MKNIKLILLLLLFVGYSLNNFAQDSTAAYTVITYDSPQITIDISDVTINNTVLKRKATLFTMIYNQKSKTLVLNWTVSFYANNNGDYGESMSAIAPSYSRETIADNTTFVNPVNGNILENPTGVVMGQYDWFYMIAETQPVLVNNMIRQYGLNVSNWDKR